MVWPKSDAGAQQPQVTVEQLQARYGTGGTRTRAGIGLMEPVLRAGGPRNRGGRYAAGISTVAALAIGALAIALGGGPEPAPPSPSEPAIGQSLDDPVLDSPVDTDDPLGSGPTQPAPQPTTTMPSASPTPAGSGAAEPASDSEPVVEQNADVASTQVDQPEPEPREPERNAPQQDMPDPPAASPVQPSPEPEPEPAADDGGPVRNLVGRIF